MEEGPGHSCHPAQGDARAADRGRPDSLQSDFLCPCRPATVRGLGSVVLLRSGPQGRAGRSGAGRSYSWDSSTWLGAEG